MQIEFIYNIDNNVENMLNVLLFLSCSELLLFIAIYNSFTQHNYQVILVKEFECHRDARSHSEGGNLPLVGCLKTNCLWVKGQTRCASTRPQ